jgi:hypothetical protein
MKYIKILDAVTGTDASDAVHVEGDYLLLLSGDTIGTVVVSASNVSESGFVDLDEASFTAATGKNITLPSCWIKVTYTGSTNITLRLLPFRRD